MSAEDRTANVVLTADTTNYAQQMTAASSQTNAMTQSVTNLLEKMDGLRKSTSRNLTIISASTVAGITAAAVAAADLDQRLSSLEARAKTSDRNFAPMRRDMDGLRRELPLTTNQVIALTSALDKMGSNPAALRDTVRTLTQLSASTGEDIGSLATGLVGLQRAMGTGGGGIKQYAGVLNDLSAGMKTSATATLQFSDSIAPVARTLNMAQQDVMGFSAAFASAGQDGYRAANTFNQILTGISQASRYGTKDLSMYAELVGKTREEFAALGATEQTLSVFNALGRGGESNIKTLERMGFGSAREIQAIQGVVQSGKLNEALGIARSSAAGGSGGNRLGQVGGEALKGFNDSMQVLKNNITSVTQAFGATFLPILDEVAQAMAKMAGTASAMMEPLMPLIGAGTGVIGGAIGAAGGLIGTAGTVATAALGYGLLRNSFGAGRGAGREWSGGRGMRTWQANSAGTFGAGGGTAFGRGLFSLGLGTRGIGLGDDREALGGAGGRGSVAMNRLGMGMAALNPMTYLRAGVGAMSGNLSGATGDMMRRGMAILSSDNPDYKRYTAQMDRGMRGWTKPQGFGDFARRSMMLATAGIAGLTEGTAQGYESLRPGAINNVAMRGVRVEQDWKATKTAWDAVKTGGGEASLRTATGALGRSFVTLSRSVISANAGLAKLGATAAAAGLGGAARRGMGNISSFFGGPVGIALGAGLGAYSLFSNERAQSQARVAGLEQTFGEEDPYNKYATSLGLASRATQSFADAVNAATGEIVSTRKDAMEWDPSETKSSLQGQGRQYANADIESMNATQAQAFVQTILTNSNADPRVIQESRRDIVQRFGDVMGKSIWGQATANEGTADFAGLISGEDRHGLTKFQVQQNFIDRLNSIGGAVSGSLAEADARGLGSRDKREINIAGLSALAQQLTPGMTDEATQATKETIEEMLGVSNADFSSIINGRNMARQGDTEALGRAVRQFFIDNDIYDEATLNGLWYSNSDFARSTFSFRSAQEAWQDPTARIQARTSAAGAALWNPASSTAQLIQSGVNQEGNANANASASRLWIDKLQSMGMTTDEIVNDFQSLINATGDLTTAQGQAAMAAQSLARQMQQADLIGGSQADSVAMRMGNMRVASRDTSDNAAENYAAAQQDIVSLIGDVTGQLQSIVKARRSFDQSNAWGREDFGRGRERSDYQFNLQRERSEEDFARSRRESDEDYALSRMHSDEDYYLSRSRSLYQFNLQREQSEYDFNLSRQRSEADFNHQRELMAEQSAKSLANIYQRIGVQPTWDARNLLGNAKDQVATFRKQLEDLKKLRGMGISADTIKLMGLNDPANAQQVARMVADLQNAPELVSEFNRATADRFALGELFSTDKDNTQWEEMRRSFELSADRAAEDFERMADRSQKAFNLSMDQMADDYTKSMRRMEEQYDKTTRRSTEAYERMTDRQDKDYRLSVNQMIEDFERQMDRAEKQFSMQFEQINGQIGDLQDEALNALSGNAEKQLRAVLANMQPLANELNAEAKAIGKGVYDAIEGAFPAAYLNDIARAQSMVFERQQFGQSGVGPYKNGAFGGGDEDAPVTAGSKVSPLSSAPGSMPAQQYGAPRDGGRRKHEGVDYPAAVGTPIFAVLDGTAYTKWSTTGGNMTTIDHGNGWWTNYLHQSGYDITNGEHVTAGQRIGRVGNTGSASRGAHLHFEARQGGQYGTSTDPLKWLGAAVSAASGGSTFDTMAQWNDFIKESAKPTEDAIKTFGYLKNVMPQGAFTKVGQYRTGEFLNNQGFLANGAIFDRTNNYRVGERGSELLLPLNHQGADYLADTMMKMSKRIDQKAQGYQMVAPQSSNTYHQTFDASVNFTGDVHVESNDPNEMARKLAEKARLRRLVRNG